MAVTLAPKNHVLCVKQAVRLRAERDAVHFLRFPVFSIYPGLPCLSDIVRMVPVQKVIEADLALHLHEVVDCSLNILKNS
jgi:hypothetical protein